MLPVNYPPLIQKQPTALCVLTINRASFSPITASQGTEGTVNTTTGDFQRLVLQPQRSTPITVTLIHLSPA
ncbi:hypothetical protein GYMLUDRAFT_834464 [Collybiopsis luxurians FD-317 M1]|uniref:Unplaced genomic scaffold GYMLUscaffold_56, whole genome shotgun sequence n=1 Tax=Collybiopsis luxurians FD-317 M1 TaxID=944289 RepID=A0A0D0BLL0_9AGAR|nr:hypothetical protein GYMLUDRAFT_834464 [Collybiopsis luxurians FD-317 M1]